MAKRARRRESKLDKAAAGIGRALGTALNRIHRIHSDVRKVMDARGRNLQQLGRDAGRKIASLGRSGFEGKAGPRERHEGRSADEEAHGWPGRIQTPGCRATSASSTDEDGLNGPGRACATGRSLRVFSVRYPWRVVPAAGVAQLVEQLIRNQQVTRSSRVAGSKFLRKNTKSIG